MGIPWVSFTLLVSPLRHLVQHPQAGQCGKMNPRNMLYCIHRKVVCGETHNTRLANTNVVLVVVIKLC